MTAKERAFDYLRFKLGDRCGCRVLEGIGLALETEIIEECAEMIDAALAEQAKELESLRNQNERIVTLYQEANGLRYDTQKELATCRQHLADAEKTIKWIDSNPDTTVTSLRNAAITESK